MSSDVFEAVALAGLIALASDGVSHKATSSPPVPVPSASGTAVPHQEPLGPEVSGWEAEQDGFVCRHPSVKESCNGGWCRIPSGCFIMGAPETEFGQGPLAERLTAVTLTHAFEMMQAELTQGQWLTVARINPSSQTPGSSDADIVECPEPECPVGRISWFDAIAYANELSARHVPPLRACYELLGCTGELGNLSCESSRVTSPTLYACEGYRLPTEAEWEYAARAGTRTAYYSGDITVTVHGVPDPNLEEIAWYAANSYGKTRPAKGKRPNRWGLFDMLGNAEEWVNNPPQLTDPPGPLTDPEVVLKPFSTLNGERTIKNGRVNSWPKDLRAAAFDYLPANTQGRGVTARLVRTLFNANAAGAGGAQAQ